MRCFPSKFMKAWIDDGHYECEFKFSTALPKCTTLINIYIYIYIYITYLHIYTYTDEGIQFQNISVWKKCDSLMFTTVTYIKDGFFMYIYYILYTYYTYVHSIYPIYIVYIHSVYIYIYKPNLEGIQYNIIDTSSFMLHTIFSQYFYL